MATDLTVYPHTFKPALKSAGFAQVGVRETLHNDKPSFCLLFYKRTGLIIICQAEVPDAFYNSWRPRLGWDLVKKARQ